MGDSVEIRCNKCKEDSVKEEIPTGEKKRKSLKEIMKSFEGNLKIGRGMKSTHNFLPGYCNTCHKISSTTAEDPYCKKCNSLFSLCGRFNFRSKEESGCNHNFYYPLSFLDNNPFGLTIENIVEASELSISQKAIIKSNQEIIADYELNFTIDLDRNYYCPQCKTENLYISRGYIMWD